MAFKKMTPEEKAQARIDRAAKASNTVVMGTSNGMVAARQNASATNSGYVPHYVYLKVNEKFAWKFGMNIALRNHEGLPKMVDNGGKEIPLYRITQRVTRFDVNIPKDASIVANAKESYKMFEGDPHYIVEDEQAEAVNGVSDFELQVQGANALMEMIKQDKEAFISFSRLFAINPDRMTFDRVKKEMYDFAQSRPREVLEALSDPLRNYREIFRKASHRKVIDKANGLWYWSGQVMGATFDEAVKWLVDNEDVVHSIVKQSEAALI